MTALVETVGAVGVGSSAVLGCCVGIICALLLCFGFCLRLLFSEKPFAKSFQETLLNPAVDGNAIQLFRKLFVIFLRSLATGIELFDAVCDVPKKCYQLFVCHFYKCDTDKQPNDPKLSHADKKI